MSKNKEAKKLIPLLEGYTGPGKLPQDLSKLKIPDGLQKSVKFRYSLVTAKKIAKTAEGNNIIILSQKEK